MTSLGRIYLGTFIAKLEWEKEALWQENLLLFDSTTTAKDFPLYITMAVSALVVEMNIEDLKVNFLSPYFKSCHREVTNPNPVFLWEEAELKVHPRHKWAISSWTMGFGHCCFVSQNHLSCSALMGACKSQIYPIFSKLCLSSLIFLGWPEFKEPVQLFFWISFTPCGREGVSEWFKWPYLFSALWFFVGICFI